MGLIDDVVARATSPDVRRKVGHRIPPVRRLLDQRDALAAQRDSLAAQVVAQKRELESRAPAPPPAPPFPPILSLEEVRAQSERIFATPPTLPEIDLQADAQLDLVRTVSPFAHDMAWPEQRTEGYRYYFDNDWFTYGDAVVLHCMLRFLEPARIIEIGSGFSSAMILDTNDRNLGGRLHCTFIEPHPERLLTLLRGDDASRASIIVSPFQDVALPDVLGTLQANDVLFIDSSHISSVGSDVNRLIFDVLPDVPRGVFVHVHDIFYPFEYPKDWVYEGRGWNEAYILRAYLQANAGYRIRLWNSHLATFHRAEVARLLPNWDRNPGSSIWLERV
jgi:hypothetical protein